MNKITKSTFVVAALFSAGVATANAKNMTAQDIEKLSYFVDAAGEENYATVYIHGKHVHVGTITMADLVLSADTLKGAPSVLYYKDGNNNWSDIIANKAVATKNLEFEMVKLIGQPRVGTHVSSDTSNNVYDEDYLTYEELPDGRVSEEFVNENDSLEAVSIRPLQKDLELNNQINTDIAAYNRNAVSIVSFENNTLVLKENSPLLEYGNVTTTTRKSTNSWFGLLVKTNKLINATTSLTVTVGGVSYTIDSVDISKAKDNYGADIKEFVLWLNTNSFNNGNNTITIKGNGSGDTVTQTITVKYTKLYPVFDYETDTETNIVSSNADVMVKTVKIGDKYKNIFYVEKNTTKTSLETTTKKIDFTQDGIKKTARYGSDSKWHEYDLINISNISAVAPSSTVEPLKDADWNQAAITSIGDVVSHTRTTDEVYDYEIDVNAKNVLKGTKEVSLNIDLGVAGVTNAGYKASSSTATNGVLKVTFTNDEYADVTFANSTIETIIVRFKIVYDESLNMTVKAYKGADNIDLFPGSIVSDETTANTNYKGLMKSLEFSEIIYDEENDKYVLNIQTTDALDEHDPYKYNNDSQKWISVVMDLGVDPTKLTLNASPDGSVIRTTDVDRFAGSNASSTAFVLWVYPSGSSNTIAATFTNKDTNASVKVDINVKEYEIYTAASPLSGKTVEVLTKTDDVKYLGNGQFRINKNTGAFVVKVTDENESIEYTYDISDPSAKKVAGVRNIKLVNVYKNILITDTDPYLTAALKSIDFDANTNTINVVFDRPIDMSDHNTAKFGLLFDIGFLLNDEKVVNGNESKALDKRLSEEDQAKVPDNHSLILVPFIASETNGEDGVTATLALQTSDGKVTSIPVEYTVKSTVVNSRTDNPVLKEENTSSLDKEDIKEAFSGSADELNNNEAISTYINENNEIEITYDKALKPLSGKCNNNSCFGVIMDLGVDPKTITSDKYTFGTNGDDERVFENISKFGVTKDTQFILWLDAEHFLPEENEEGELTGRKTLKLTFTTSENSQNKFASTTVTFVLIDGIQELESPNVSSLNTNVVPSNVKSDSSFRVNQDNYTFTYERATENDVETGVLTIKPTTVHSATESSTIVVDGVEKTGGYYGIALDFADRDVELSTSNNNVYLTHSDVDGYILWVNVDQFTGNLDLTFKDSYNSKEFKIKLVTSNEVA